MNFTQEQRITEKNLNVHKEQYITLVTQIIQKKKKDTGLDRRYLKESHRIDIISYTVFYRWDSEIYWVDEKSCIGRGEAEFN